MGGKILLFLATLLPLLVIATANAQTTIYRHVDSDGRITYANKPIKGANKLQIITPMSKSVATINARKVLPAVSDTTQNKRDITRRQILENELTLEMELLVNARHQQLLARNSLNADLIQSRHEATQYKKNTQHIRDQILLHERNILALKKELAAQ